MRLHNGSGSVTEFGYFAIGVATVIKEMRTQGLEETTMGDVLTWLGQEDYEIDEAAWGVTFSLDDKLLTLDVDRIAAELTDQMH